MKSTPLILLLAVALAGCQSPRYADRGAALGALTGAVAGGAIGRHNNQTAAGALIGTAVGALAGAAVGDTIDADIARNNALIEQRLGRHLAGAVTLNDVVALTQAGLSDDVIITHIRANGMAERAGPENLIALSQMGVTDPVLHALQTTPPPAPPPPPVVDHPRHVVVQEYHYGPPPPPWYYGHYHRGGRGSRVHWGVSFSNR
jgi:hypothetical protein